MRRISDVFKNPTYPTFNIFMSFISCSSPVFLTYYIYLFCVTLFNCLSTITLRECLCHFQWEKCNIHGNQVQFKMTCLLSLTNTPFLITFQQIISQSITQMYIVIMHYNLRHLLTTGVEIIVFGVVHAFWPQQHELSRYTTGQGFPKCGLRTQRTMM